MNSTMKIIGGFIAGAALGAVAGILMAPESGDKTRKRMMDESKRLADQFTESLSKTLDSVKSTYNKKMEEYAQTGKSTIDNLKETMKV